MAYLLRLSPRGRPYPPILKIAKLSTSGFIFIMSGMVEGIQLNVVDGPILWLEPQSEGALDNNSVPKGLSCVDAGDEVAGFGGDDVVDFCLQGFVDFDGSLAGGGERGSAGAVALDELAAQLAFGFVYNAPGLGIRHTHALGGTVERVLAGNTLQQQDAAMTKHARQILVARLNDQLCRRLVLHTLHVFPLKCLLGKRKACVKPSCALLKSCIVAVKVR